MKIEPILRITAALLAFHARVGTRVAVRALAPVLATAFGLFYLLRPELFFMLTRRVFVEAEPFSRGLIVAAVLLAAAATTRKSICFGLGGWIRSLPVGGWAHRRAAVFAVTLAEAPITFLLYICALVGTQGLPRSVTAAMAVNASVGLVVASVAAAAAIVPSRNAAARFIFASAAAALAGSGNLVNAAFAVAVLAAVDYLSGPLTISRKSGGRHRWMVPIRFPALIGFRAMGITGWAGFLPAGLAAGLIALFLRNNDLAEPLQRAAMRLGGAMSAAVFLAFTSGFLVGSRAPWPWSRSWPRSARHRIVSDTLFLGIPALILCLPLSWLGWPAVYGAAALIPAGAARAAGAVNGPRETRSKILGTLLLEGSLAAAIFGLWTEAGIAFLFVTPLLIELGARREQTLKVTAWNEMHHDAAGDPGSWSTR
ncbi:MAG: hypothetical protein JW843_03695 [Candidatus Aminicenantes bacterium]|nr:hypothetical protein [Candidatus Aminicenantes bacterium]